MLPKLLPEPEILLPHRGEPVLRWGVIAPGWIAGYFVPAVQRHTSQRVEAVASRSRDRAEAFAREHGIARAYGTYEQLLEDPAIDVVYIAAPQSEHLVLGLLAIASGKHVLIEKPLALNASEGEVLADAARTAGVFLMEAMWSRYQPQAALIRRLLADGVIGDVGWVAADHGQAAPRDPAHRLNRPELGGGALLDLGIYPVQLDSMVLGTPTSITAVGGLTETGVDAYSTLVLGHGPGVQSTLATNLLTRTPTTAVIAGSEGRIEIEGPFHLPTAVTVYDLDLFGERLHWRDQTGVALLDGLAWEATALATYVGEGRAESPLHTLDETVSILRTIDEARRQLGAR